MNKTCACSNDNDNSSLFNLSQNNNNTSVAWERLETAKKNSHSALSKLLKKDKTSSIIDMRCHYGENDAFFLTSIGLEKENVHVSVSGVMNRLPYDYTLSANGSVFLPKRQKRVKNNDNILWIKMQVLNPYEYELDIPFSLQGIVRNPNDGSILKFDDFQLVPSLLANRSDNTVWCLVGCLGLGAIACGVECAWAFSIPPVPGPFITCIGVCMGANSAEIALCIAACRNISG